MMINNVKEFADVIPTAVAVTEFDDLKSYVKSAEYWLKLNVLGSKLYDRVIAIHESSTGEEDEALLMLCRNVIANHAYWDAIPFLDVVHTNTGFAVIQNDRLVPASRDRVASLREQCLIRRDAEVESLIDYLEDKPEYHEDWKVSSAFSILSDCLITTARELAIYAEWEGSRKEFLKLRPKLIQLTISKIQPNISRNYVNELIEMQRGENVDADDLVMLTLLKQVLGSLVIGNDDAAKQALEDAINYMDGSPASYSTYFESKEYAARTTANYENTKGSPIYFSLH